jgi:hypothetical protein
MKPTCGPTCLWYVLYDVLYDYFRIATASQCVVLNAIPLACANKMMLGRWVRWLRGFGSVSRTATALGRLTFGLARCENGLFAPYIYI